MTVRKAEIEAAIDEFKLVYDEWLELTEQDQLNNDPKAQGLFVPYRGMVVKRIPEWLAEAAQELFALCDTMDIERDAWPLVQILDEFDDAFLRVSEALKIPGSEANPGGGEEVWRPWERLVQLRKRPRIFPLVEPIPQLRQMPNITPEQICKMYGWYVNDDKTRPDLQKLQREIDNPGSEFDPDKWVHPGEQKYWAELETWWSEREVLFEKMAVTKPKPKEPARESLEDLVRMPNMSKAQIVKMKPEVTIEEIDAMAEELGIAMELGGTPTFWESQQKRMAQYEKAIKPKLSSELATIETYAELGSSKDGVRQRVLRMAEDGHSPGKISQALRNQLPNPLSSAQIGKIIKAAEREAAEAAAGPE